ncbi:MAG: spermidine/putrescine ABC transporter substrate-binding protein [Oscillospiraceae bacterium]|jgi:spermidine/putrescine-binding protein|nr:spermidine/putrescine ABC transporter substrate-binding protein [Oscillospiraceae bacterium]
MRIKRIAAGILAAAAVLSLSLTLFACGKKSDKTLYIYNWSEYIPQEVYDLFRQETGIEVKETTFEDNEEMLAKLEAQGASRYDLVVPSSYVIGIMKQKGYIQPIEKDKVPNLKNISADALGKNFDPNNEYSLPYMATMTVIAVNVPKLAELGVEIKSLNDLLDPRLEKNLVVVDDQRELISAALKATGQDPDTQDEATILGTLDWLIALKKNVKEFSTNNSKVALETNSVAAGLVFNLDAGLAIFENPDITVIYTTEPCELAMDNFVITAGAKHKDYAQQFIDFVYRPEIYKMILDEFPGVCLNDAAKALLDEDYLANPGATVDSYELGRAHITQDVGDAVEYYDDVYTKMKIN